MVRYRWYYAELYCEAKRKADKAGESSRIVLGQRPKSSRSDNSEGVKRSRESEETERMLIQEELDSSESVEVKS